MIASEDVRRVTFERAMRGYRCDDVDDYLKQVADSMDALAADNEDLQKKLVVLAQRIDQYRAEEDTLRTTMINAQRLGENVIKEAKQKAAEIIRSANIKAEDREQHARDEVELAKQEVTTLKREADSFKKSLLEMYRKHIEVLSKIPEYPENPEQQAVPVQQPTPQPEPEPDPEPDVYEQPAPQPEPKYSQQEYYEEPQPEPAAVPEPEEEKVDTVEFAIAPKPDEPQDLRQNDDLATPFQPGAGLYDEPAPAPAPAPKKTTRSRSTSKTRTTRKKAQPVQPAEDLPASLDSFSGVDFDS